MQREVPAAVLEGFPELHVSLSKTFYAKHWHIGPLREAVLASLRGAALPPLVLDRFAVYANEGGTRTFLALDAAAESAAQVLHACAASSPARSER